MEQNLCFYFGQISVFNYKIELELETARTSLVVPNRGIDKGVIGYYPLGFGSYSKYFYAIEKRKFFYNLFRNKKY